VIDVPGNPQRNDALCMLSQPQDGVEGNNLGSITWKSNYVRKQLILPYKTFAATFKKRNAKQR
jgi:hypothetical protein